MFEHLLVPLDGSAAAEGALPVAAAVARKTGGRVTLLHLIERRAPEQVHGETHLRDRSEADEYLRQAAARFLPPDLRPEWHVHEEATDSVAGGIVDHLLELGPDAVVMSVHGHHGIGRWIHGNLAQQVLARGRIPVFLARHRGIVPETIEWKEILMPHDGEPLHDSAAPAAEFLARRFEAELVLIRVVPTVGALAGSESAAGSLMPRATRAVLDIARVDAESDLGVRVEALRGRGICAAFEVVRGQVDREIAAAARRRRAGLIVLSSHGKAGTQAFWNRSMGARVLRRCESTVLLVPAEAVEENGELRIKN